MPDAHPLLPWLTPERRAWLYRLVTAALPLLVAYGLLADTDAALWAALVAAFLGSSTAVLHTPRSRTQPRDPDTGRFVARD